MDERIVIPAPIPDNPDRGFEYVETPIATVRVGQQVLVLEYETKPPRIFKSHDKAPKSTKYLKESVFKFIDNFPYMAKRVRIASYMLVIQHNRTTKTVHLVEVLGGYTLEVKYD